MKKILVFIFALFSLSVALGYHPCEPWPSCEDPLYEGDSMDFGLGHVGSNTDNTNTTSSNDSTSSSSNPNSDCPNDKKYKNSNGGDECCYGGIVETDPTTQIQFCILNTQGNLGINIDSDCLKNGQCSMNIYQTLGIRKSDQNPNVSSFVQDIVLGITMFIGTVITIVLIISGILYPLSAITGKSSLADIAKKGIFNSILGLVLVTGSYAIVRLIQFVATGGS